MALVECRECSKLVSTQAVSCPGCGAPYPAWNPPNTVAVTLQHAVKNELDVATPRLAQLLHELEQNHPWIAFVPSSKEPTKVVPAVCRRHMTYEEYKTFFRSCAEWDDMLRKAGIEPGADFQTTAPRAEQFIRRHLGLLKEPHWIPADDHPNSRTACENRRGRLLEPGCDSGTAQVQLVVRGDGDNGGAPYLLCWECANELTDATAEDIEMCDWHWI